jgi:hypothetical protein
MSYTSRVITALALAGGLAASAVAAPPTSGAYVDDTQNTWVQDRVGDRIGTVNMIMCIMSSLRPDALVNQGAYVALVDQGKCEGRGDSSKSTSTNAGASNATNYLSATVVSEQATNADPLTVKIWLHEEEDHGSGPEKMTIYVYIVATEGKSESNPNGLFSMYFCGTPDGLNTCMFRGTLKSDGTGLSFYQAESGGGGGGGGSSETNLKLQSNPNTDSGLGRVQGTEGGNPYAYTFAFDGNYFHRSDGAADECFARDRTLADTSTWSYGVYNPDGSRLEVTNPGFSVKYVSGANTYYGFWSFWGLWLPDSALATVGSSGTLTRQVNNVDVPLTVVRRGGKLWKLTKHQTTLGSFKNVSMMYWSPNPIGSGPSNTNYELQWDGSALNAIGYQQCSPGSPCSQTAFVTPVALDATALAGLHVRALPIFFPSGGGNGAVLVPASGNFSGADVVTYRTREVVEPSAPDVALNCIGMCPKTGTNLVSGGNLAASPYQDAGSWGPTSTRYAYTWQAGMLSDGGGNADASGASKDSMGMNQWGLTSGSMVTDSDLPSIRCDANGQANSGGAYYCQHLVDQASVIYQWETGPNQWNRYFGAAGVTIDPPRSLSFTAQASPANISAADVSKFDGNTVQLQYNGFGQLQGIPGACVNPDTNLPANCDPSTRWVPAFDIRDGSSVADGADTFYVKYLQRELRLRRTSCASAPSLTAASSLTLPNSTAYDVDPMATNGAEPTPASSKPKVIDGIVQ